MKKIGFLIAFPAVVFLAAATLAQAKDDDSAYDQLQNMSNTGTTFDGSDGERSGMDYGMTPSSGNIPEPPPPTPVYGESEDYTSNTESGDSGSSDSDSNDQTSSSQEASSETDTYSNSSNSSTTDSQEGSSEPAPTNDDYGTGEEVA